MFRAVLPASPMKPLHRKRKKYKKSKTPAWTDRKNTQDRPAFGYFFLGPPPPGRPAAGHFAYYASRSSRGPNPKTTRPGPEPGGLSSDPAPPKMGEPTHKIVSVQFGTLSVPELLRFSAMEVTRGCLYEKGIPSDNAINSLELGTCDNTLRCKTCRHDVRRCPGHFGHLKLTVPCYHPLFIDHVVKLLRAVCFWCSRTLLPHDDRRVLPNLRPRSRFAVVCTASKGRKCPHCEGQQPHYVRVGMFIKADWPKGYEHATPGEAAPAAVPVDAGVAHRILRDITDEDAAFCGVDPERPAREPRAHAPAGAAAHHPAVRRVPGRLAPQGPGGPDPQARRHLQEQQRPGPRRDAQGPEPPPRGPAAPHQPLHRQGHAPEPRALPGQGQGPAPRRQPLHQRPLQGQEGPLPQQHDRQAHRLLVPRRHHPRRRPRRRRGRRAAPGRPHPDGPGAGHRHQPRGPPGPRPPRTRPPRRRPVRRPARRHPGQPRHVPRLRPRPPPGLRRQPPPAGRRLARRQPPAHAAQGLHDGAPGPGRRGPLPAPQPLRHDALQRRLRRRRCVCVCVCVCACPRPPLHRSLTAHPRTIAGEAGTGRADPRTPARAQR